MFYCYSHRRICLLGSYQYLCFTECSSFLDVSIGVQCSLHLYIWWICLNVQCPIFFQYDGWQCWSRKYLSSNHYQVLMRSMMKTTLWSVQQGKEDKGLPIIHQTKMLPWSGHGSPCPLMPLQELIKVVAPFGAASQSTFTVMAIQQRLEQSARSSIVGLQSKNVVTNGSHVLPKLLANIQVESHFKNKWVGHFVYFVHFIHLIMTFCSFFALIGQPRPGEVQGHG